MVPVAPPSVPKAVKLLIAGHGGTWEGTAAELHGLLPDLAPDPTRLSKILGQTVDELTAAGIVFLRRRVPKTGTRLLALSLAHTPVPRGVTLDGRVPETTASDGNVVPATSGLTQVDLPGDARSERPLLPCPTCSGRDWRWHQSHRRRASRWCCAICESQS